MKTLINTLKLLLPFAIIVCLVSCNDDNDDVSPKKPEVPEVQKGRFDEKPFEWDEKYGFVDSSNDIFLGFTSPNGLYLGASFPKKALPYTFDREIMYPRNSQYISFHLKNPISAEITTPKGFSGYYLALKDAIKLDEFNNHNSDASAEKIEFTLSEIYTYADLTKSFEYNPKFGETFTTQVKQNNKLESTKIKSRFVVRLVSRNFTVSMASPRNGFFQNPEYNMPGSDPAYTPTYISSITYGKAAFVCVESQSSSEETKAAINVAIKATIMKENVEYDYKSKEIMSKSSITIFTQSVDTGGSSFMTGENNLSKALPNIYTKYSYGFPMYYTANYVHNDAAYINE